MRKLSEREVEIVQDLHQEMSEQGIVRVLHFRTPLSAEEMEQNREAAVKIERLLSLGLDDPEFIQAAANTGMTSPQFFEYCRLRIDYVNATTGTTQYARMEALEYAEGMYARLFIQNESLQKSISIEDEQKIKTRKQRNFFAFLSIILLALCLFLALRPAADPAPAPTPTVSATRSTSTSQRNYVASVNSNKYHLPTCDYAENIQDANLVFYATEADAKADGKKPCSICSP